MRRFALGLFVGLLSLVTFLLGFVLWLSVDNFVIMGRSGIALVLIILSTALFRPAWRLMTTSLEQREQHEL